MLYRKTEEKIKAWLANPKTALLIDGARQVGKTTTILKVLKEEKTDYIYFNLLKNKKMQTILNNVDNMTSNEFLENITTVVHRKLKKNETIIFIDEVQTCKELLTMVKFLVEEGSYNYILSGSVLGITLQNLRSAPVGYLSIEKMYPLDFEEFITALGTQPETIQNLNNHFNNLTPVPQIAHETMIANFYKFLVIGGMPAAVQSFVDNKDYNEVHKIHKNIIELNKADFAKYQSADKKLKLMATYDLIPTELNAQNKRYVFKNLNRDYKLERYESTFEWLYAAEVAIPVFNVTSPETPLKLNEKSSLFKLFLNDVGLLASMYGKETIRKLITKDGGVNFGAVFENYIAQELHAHGYSGYYYKNKKYGELDFVIEKDGIIPIEVKSGAAITRHNALINVMSNKAYNIKQGIVFSTENLSHATFSCMHLDKDFEVREKYTIIYMPIYMSMFIDEDKIDLNDF